MRKTIWVFLLCSFSVFAKAEQKSFWKPVHPVSDSLLLQIEQARPHHINYPKEKVMIDELYRIADSLGNPILLSRAMYCDAWNQQKFNSDSTATLLRKAVLLIDTLAYPYDYARISYLWGYDFLYAKEDFLNAYITYKNLLAYFKEIGDAVYVANTLMSIGNLFYILDDSNLALSYLEEANTHYEKINLSESRAKNQLNIANVLYQNEQKQAAVDKLKTILEDPVCQQDTDFWINVLLSVVSQSSDIQDKGKYIREAYTLSMQHPDNNLLAKSLINHTAFYIDSHQPDSALIYAREAIRISMNQKNLYRLACNNLSLIYAEYQQWDSAYHYSRLYHIYTDSIYHSDKIKEIYKMQTREAIQLYEIQLEHTQKEAKLQQTIALSVLSGLFCLFISLFVIFRLKGKKTKVEKQLKEAENKELNERLKSEGLQKENLQLEIDSQNRELASNTLLLSEKNRILVSLEKQINEMGNDGTLPAKEEKELKKQIQTHLQAADEWEYFKLHFEKVHPGFFFQLKTISPAFSENELRLCAYIRIGMSAKQLSQMLSVLPETINTARYRLRKKLALEPEVSLEDFLRKI